MVTHDRGLAGYADKIIHVLDGKIQSIEVVEKKETNQAEVSEEIQQEEVAITEEVTSSDSNIKSDEKKEGKPC